MKTKEFKEFKSKDKKEIIKEINAKKLELMQIAGKMYAGKEKNLKKVKNLRHDVAQMMTILNDSKRSETEKKEKKNK